MQLDTTVLYSIVSDLIKILRKQDFLTYFKKLSLLDFNETEKTLTLGVVSEFIKDNLQYKFQEQILTVSKKYLSVEKIIFEVDNNIETPSYSQAISCLEIYKDSKKKNKNETPGTTVVEGVESRVIQEKYTLENFIVGPSNQLAYAACQAVSRKPGSAYNPLFIYGEVGLGKTHLLQATGNAIRKKFKRKKIIYTTADRFLNDYVKSVKNRTVDRLRDKYRNIDVLIIDDVQFLARKTATQEELYNIFNMMYETNRQIIISSDRPPRELTELEPRLLSRFEWGIIVDISEPDFETRLAILQEKARHKEFIMPQDVAEFIACNLGSNVRELEGILNQIIAEYELHGTPPTVQNISHRMQKLSITSDPLGTRNIKPKIRIKTYEDLITAVSEHFGLLPEQIMGNDRQKQYMIPRQIAMYLLKKKMNYTYDRIGNIFSGRNHSAILYSCKKLETILKKDQKLHYEINVIRDKVWL